ncbi:60S ribosome subunit biogenesis protein [Heterostelium album PN500]|uniref:60S ribosome subunit biogenesis protein NIP7 homolog n=1 Tax=Heterostelium pallidum (strain ATCC 26659 / Pp 5 / PN500) TaxID=670386 RepID=D3BH65_HETP5|nr:60S ribosome subunit biogenesis protein [Heterostelium album PN500]EFA79449.1 60S ribosome subunit biogenesis protein [Heterostelium album PN500]|eukprot:XP_020431570.1 60S ribosome subunit biogenesis protein [Heterostelium album PN500]
MRKLTDEETKVFFEKIIKYVGKNITLMVERKDEPHCFRVQKNKVYYISEDIMRKAQNIPRDSLASLGTCFGKFTKSGKFKLQITCLEYLAQYAKVPIIFISILSTLLLIYDNIVYTNQFNSSKQYKVWVKPQSEMSWMYGNNLLKAGLGRITEDTPQNQGVVLYSMNDIPIGFGVTAKSTGECRKLDPTALVVYHICDVGEYLRDEDTLF